MDELGERGAMTIRDRTKALVTEMGELSLELRRRGRDEDADAVLHHRDRLVRWAEGMLRRVEREEQARP